MKEAFTATGDKIEGTLASEARVPVATDPSVAHETVLQPSRGWRSIGFRELRGYRELLYFLTWRDIKVRYKQTVLGAIWAILQPVISMIIFSIIFGKFAKIPSNGVPYPIFVYAGLLPWTFFSNAVSRSGMSLVTSVNLLTKIYFPRLLIPTASVGAALVDFALSFLIYVGIMLWYMHLPGLSVLLLPVLVLLTVMTALGTGYVLASLAVVYRDFRIVIPFMIQVWMWASPVVYPVTLLPEQFRWVMALNPMSGIIGGYRSVLLNQPMDWSSLGVSTLVGSVIFVYGIFNFRRAERRFADIA
jgi:lipopolysaccharide transport system permease protein